MHALTDLCQGTLIEKGPRGVAVDNLIDDRCLECQAADTVTRNASQSIAEVEDDVVDV